MQLNRDVTDKGGANNVYNDGDTRGDASPNLGVSQG